MITEVFKNGRTIGFVANQNRLKTMDTVRKMFPEVDRVATSYVLPKHDKRCKEIAKDVYAWIH